MQTVQIVEAAIKQNWQKAISQYKITVRVADGYEIIDLNKILYIEAVDSYSRIVMANGECYLQSKNLLHFEELLPAKRFWRIHKSYIINIQHLVKVFKGPPVCMIMTNGETVPVSSRKKMELFERLNWLVF